MKKFFAITLAIVMTMAMATTAFATEGSGKVEGENGGTQNIDVSAKYSESTTTVGKVSVNVSWEAMEFTYSVGGTKEWNPDTHKYDNKSTAGWTGTGNTITVTNHSDSAVKIDFAFKADDAYATVTGSFNNPTINLPSAVNKTTTDAELTGTSTLTLDGTLASSVTSLTKVGTITVKITKVN